MTDQPTLIYRIARELRRHRTSTGNTREGMIDRQNRLILEALIELLDGLPQPELIFADTLFDSWHAVRTDD